MRLPNTEFTSRPWRVHELTPDFEVEDVWALPTPGGPDDLDRLVRQMTGPDDKAIEGNPILRALFALRWKLGALFGWDKPRERVGRRVASLRDRLPADLRGDRGPDMSDVPFTSVYRTHDEWLAESANRTVHVLLHLGWVSDGTGGYYAQMTGLVRPNGLLGRVYMVGIKPIRYTLVYPALLRGIGREWRLQTAG
ncbi:DUF2867 domain-containing protein [Nocardia crassostreae]|uniref:DUF2867 domain-containing protein n=1 Tax=Nocardia crassostreae TaxID=53428 RepID=UPI0008302208|nr:DUF2867 domain-containing protein [Nocardia crassostreae]